MPARQRPLLQNRIPDWLNMPSRIICCWTALFLAVAASDGLADSAPEFAFFEKYCYDCHQGADSEAGWDLSALPTKSLDELQEQRWVRVLDRVRDGEMPPAEMGAPAPEDVKSFVETTGTWIRDRQRTRYSERGRVQGRRLTRREIERSLHDLLGIDIPLANQLPEEPRPSVFTTVASRQAMSHFQIERHLTVVDVALDEAFRRALSPEDSYVRDFDARGVARKNPKRRTREPEMLDGSAVVWSSGLIYYGRIPATRAPADGWYRFRLEVSCLKPPETGGVWSTVNTGLCVSSAPLLSHVTAFEAMEEPRTIEFEAWLPKNHMLEIRPGDKTLKRARFAGGQVGAGEGSPQDVPGIAIHQLSMERIHRGGTNDDVRELLFGELEIKTSPGGASQVQTESASEELRKLLVSFARRAFRRPVTNEQVLAYVDIAQETLAAEGDFLAAVRMGLRALLCSPRFLYLTETPGRLDDHALAARLSYFLTGSTPDDQLTQLADAGRLHEKEVLLGEVERLLGANGSRRFAQDFAAEWLDLDQIDFTEPDRKLFPEFDAIVKHSMLNETNEFLATMLDEDLPVSHLVHSDFTFLNSRLARYYDLPSVAGDELQRVALRAEDHRGGVLTQGAVLKVTANGSTTSPVVRGVWVSERLLGASIPPPPDNVPAIEPDIRGAKTIREQLAKHRSQDSCASCHVKIDPPGFALENFDPAGQWRDRYLRKEGRRRVRGAEVDASYQMPDGQAFESVDEFRQLVAAEPRQLALNVAEKMVTFGTGATISFADRTAIEEIVERAAEDDYGFRSILEEVVTSPLFVSK